MEGQCRLKKTSQVLRNAVCLMLLSKNLLFMTLGTQRNMYKTIFGHSSLHFELKYFSSQTKNLKKNAQLKFWISDQKTLKT